VHSEEVSREDPMAGGGFSQSIGADSGVERRTVRGGAGVRVPSRVHRAGDTALLSELRIFCDITVEKPDRTVVAEHTVGPVSIQVPEVPLPTLLVMSEHDMDGPPSR